MRGARGVPPRPARGASLVAGGMVAAGRVRTGRACGRQPGVKNSAFTGAVPLGHSGNRARRGRPAGPSGTGRTAGRLVSAGRGLLAVADALPVTVLAVIAGAGSFTHIRDTAAQHGQSGPMSWAVAGCIDLTCGMAGRQRPRDKQLGITARRPSWPTAALAGGSR